MSYGILENNVVFYYNLMKADKIMYLFRRYICIYMTSIIHLFESRKTMMRLKEEA